MFISGVNGDGSSAEAYPYCGTKKGLWFNADIEPTGLVSSDQVTSPVSGVSTQDKNPLAPGFTANSLNFNISHTDSGYVATGGLWMGLNNLNPQGLAVDTVNLPMYPVNLSAYVVSNPKSGSQTAAPIYGGHFTLAIGDPFLINSYAAKMLWHLVTDIGYGLSNDSLSTQDLDDIRDRIAPAGADGVFVASSTSSKYARWLMDSPANAVTAINAMNEAASKPIEKESIWGHVFDVIDRTMLKAIGMAVPGLYGVTGAAAKVVTGTVSNEAFGGLAKMAVSAIDTGFTNTVSEPAPVSQNAPPSSNMTYTASNLFGMLLNNSFLQAEINNQMGLGNPSGLALYSNYSLHTATTCSNITLSSNLFAKDLGCGPKSGTAPTYDNVLSLYPQSYSNSQLNIWSAILTGADVSAQSGYPQVGSPVSAFLPPTQIINRVGVNHVGQVNPGFAQDTGMIAVAGYSVSGTGVSTPSLYAPNLDLEQAGDWSVTEWAKPPVQVPQYVTGGTATVGQWAYNATTGVVTVNGIWIGSGPSPNGGTWGAYGQAFDNGPQTLDTKQCLAGATVVITATPTGFDTMEGALSCDTGGGRLVGGAGGIAPAARPAVNLVLASAIPPNHGIGFAPPAAEHIGYDASTGLLTVTGYQGYDNSSGTSAAPTNRTFSNAVSGLSLDLTTCAEGSAANLYLYPMGGQTAEKAVGVLGCEQGPPAMPYSLCTNDLEATGGVIVALTKAPASDDGNGAEFDIGCACIPNYLGGPAIDTSATTPSPGNATFWQSSTDISGNPVGLMVGATASNPHGLCE
jgi:hypothetical protein